MSYRSLRGTRESAEGKAGHRRVAALARATDGLLRRVGWVRVWAVWRPRGRIDMGDISGRTIPTAEAMERERARRHFLGAEDLAAEVERYRVDVVEPHLRALVELITPDPMRREATRLFLLETAERLAGEGASAVLKMVAISVVVFDTESHLASSRVLLSAKSGVPHVALVRWRESAELRMNAKIKTLALVRDMEQAELSRSLARLKLVAG